MTRFQVLSWQEIPSLVRVFADDGSHTSHQLPDWFQQEIDRVAMVQGLIGSDEYLEQWSWGDPQGRPEPAGVLVDALVAEFTERFRQDR